MEKSIGSIGSSGGLKGVRMLLVVVFLLGLVVPAFGQRYFDGSDNLDLGDPSAVQGTGSHTVTCWVRCTSLPTGGEEYDFFTKGTTSWGLYLGVYDDSGTSYWGVGSSTTATNSYIFTAVATVNTWTHLAGVFDSASQTLSLYKDGAYVSNATSVGTTLHHSGNSYIGAFGAGYYFIGQVVEVRLYNRVLSAAEIKELASGKLGTILSGRVLHFPLFGPDALAMKDQSGNGVTATNNGSTADHSTQPPVWTMVLPSQVDPAWLAFQSRKLDSHYGRSGLF